MATGYFHHVPAEQMRHFSLFGTTNIHIIAEIQVDILLKGGKSYITYLGIDGRDNSHYKICTPALQNNGVFY